MSQSRSRVALVLVVSAVLALAWRAGIVGQFADPSHARATLVSLGAWGYIAFVLAYAVLQPFGIPGTVFVMAAPLIWPWPTAFGLSMVGTMAASVVGFSFARFIGREWVSTRIPARFRRYDDALARRAFATVFTLRLVFWMPPLLHAFFGVSRVRFGTHFWGSLAGYLLPLFLMSYFGQRLFDALHALPRETWWTVAAMLAGVVITALCIRALRVRSLRAAP